MENENQLYPEQLHPALADQSGFEREEEQFNTHPFLEPEIIPTNLMAVEESNIEQTSTPQPSNGQQEQVVQTQEEQNLSEQDSNFRSWRAFREKKSEEVKQAKLEAESLARERDFYREQALKSQKQPETQEDYRTDTEKHLYQQMEELKQQLARNAQETEKARRQTAIAQAEQRLLQDYPDIKSVVSEENIQRLEVEYPHLYNTVVSSSDIYAVGSTAYELIIAKGIAQPKKNTLQQLTQTSNPNKSKPRSVSTISPQGGDTPISKAGNFMGRGIISDEEKKALWKEMVECSPHKVF